MANTFDLKSLEKFQHETPFFLFSKERIIKKFNDFKEYFPHSSIYYALKANSEPEILKTLTELGSGFEVASIYELHILEKLGVPADKIIYGTSVKALAHIKEVFEYGVDRFAFDSLSELEKIASVAPGARVYVRIRADDTGSVFKFSEKFGTDRGNVVPFLERARELGLKPYGISFHVGSQASNVLAWSEAISGLGEILERLQKIDIKIEMIDIGGGFPCFYPSVEEEITLKEIAEKTIAQYKKLPYQPKMILEPGRGLVAESGVLVTSVIARIDRKENTWLFLDAGVYNALFEAMVFQGSTRYRITSLRPSYDSGEQLFSIAGPTGDSPDVIMREALLPQDVGVGDKLIIHDVGAYSLVVSSRFNGFPKPSVYLI